MSSKLSKKPINIERSIQREIVKKRKSKVFMDSYDDNEYINDQYRKELITDNNKLNKDCFFIDNLEINNKHKYLINPSINNVSSFPDIENSSSNNLEISTNYNSIEKMSMCKYSLDAFLNKNNNINDKDLDDCLKDFNLDSLNQEHQDKCTSIYKTNLKEDSILCSNNLSLSNYLITEKSKHQKYTITDFSNNIKNRLNNYNSELQSNDISNLDVQNNNSGKEQIDFKIKENTKNKNINLSNNINTKNKISSVAFKKSKFLLYIIINNIIYL